MIVNPSLRRRSYRKLAKRLRDFAACLASGSEGERSCRNGGKLPDSPDYHFAADVVARAEGRPGRAS
jgi:hypothetical protein